MTSFTLATWLLLLIPFPAIIILCFLGWVRNKKV